MQGKLLNVLGGSNDDQVSDTSGEWKRLEGAKTGAPRCRTASSPAAPLRSAAVSSDSCYPATVTFWPCGRFYPSTGAITTSGTGETVDGTTLGKIGGVSIGRFEASRATPFLHL